MNVNKTTKINPRWQCFLSYFSPSMQLSVVLCFRFCSLWLCTSVYLCVYRVSCIVSTNTEVLKLTQNIRRSDICRFAYTGIHTYVRIYIFTCHLPCMLIYVCPYVCMYARACISGTKSVNTCSSVNFNFVSLACRFPFAPFSLFFSLYLSFAFTLYFLLLPLLFLTSLHVFMQIFTINFNGTQENVFFKYPCTLKAQLV